VSDGINIRFGKGPFGKLREGQKYLSKSPVGAKSKGSNRSSCSGAAPSQLLCLKTKPYQSMRSKSGGG